MQDKQQSAGFEERHTDDCQNENEDVTSNDANKFSNKYVHVNYFIISMRMHEKSIEMNKGEQKVIYHQI